MTSEEKCVFMHKFCEYFYAEYMCRNGKVGFGFFFCIFQIEATMLGNEANFTHGNLKLLRETLVNVMCESTVCLYTQAFCVLRTVYAQRTTWAWT